MRPTKAPSPDLRSPKRTFSVSEFRGGGGDFRLEAFGFQLHSLPLSAAGATPRDRTVAVAAVGPAGRRGTEPQMKKIVAQPVSLLGSGV